VTSNPVKLAPKLTAWKVFGLFLISGIVVALIGFFYDVFFAGIPYQDPTPELTAEYNFHSNVTHWIRLVGLGICALAIPAGLVQKLWSKPPRKNG
jgi:hypothetical protein